MGALQGNYTSSLRDQDTMYEIRCEMALLQVMVERRMKQLSWAVKDCMALGEEELICPEFRVLKREEQLSTCGGLGRWVS